MYRDFQGCFLMISPWSSPSLSSISWWFLGAPRRRVLIIGGSFSGLAAGRDLGSHYLVTIIDAKDGMGMAWGSMARMARSPLGLKGALGLEVLKILMSMNWWWMVMNGDIKLQNSFRWGSGSTLWKNGCSRLSHQADAVEILGFCMRSISSTLLESCGLTSSPSTWMPWPSPCSQSLRQLHHEMLPSQMEREVRGECKRWGPWSRALNLLIAVILKIEHICGFLRIGDPQNHGFQY